jgi:uncharacterized protein
MPLEKQITIHSHDLDLAATIHFPSGKRDRAIRQTSQYPLIIICHGFVGSRIGVNRLFVKAARELSDAGFTVLRFDYGGCGESTGDYGAGGLDALIEQTRRVIDYGLEIEGVDPGRVILLGHSLGGAVSILTAGVDPRVKTLVLWSAVAHPFHDIVRIVGKQAYEESERSGAVDYLGYSLTNNFFASLSRYHPFQHAKHFTGDVLLIHGSQDEVIPVEYCFLYQKLFAIRKVNSHCEKEIIHQADHTFSSIDSTDRLLKKTRDWLLRVHKGLKAVNDPLPIGHPKAPDVS